MSSSKKLKPSFARTLSESESEQDREAARTKLLAAKSGKKPIVVLDEMPLSGIPEKFQKQHVALLAEKKMEPAGSQVTETSSSKKKKRAAVRQQEADKKAAQQSSSTTGGASTVDDSTEELETEEMETTKQVDDKEPGEQRRDESSKRDLPPPGQQEESAAGQQQMLDQKSLTTTKSGRPRGDPAAWHFQPPTSSSISTEQAIRDHIVYIIRCCPDLRLQRERVWAYLDVANHELTKLKRKALLTAKLSPIRVMETFKEDHALGTREDTLGEEQEETEPKDEVFLRDIREAIDLDMRERLRFIADQQTELRDTQAIKEVLEDDIRDLEQRKADLLGATERRKATADSESSTDDDSKAEREERKQQRSKAKASKSKVGKPHAADSDDATTVGLTSMVQFIDQSHRMRLTGLDYSQVVKFREMLENEKAQQRGLTSADAVALIDKVTQGLIYQQLRNALDLEGQPRFTAEVATNWRKLDPDILCQHLLQTLDHEHRSTNATLASTLKKIRLPSAYDSKAKAHEFQTELHELSLKHGDNYDFKEVLPADEHKEVIREWMRQAKSSRSAGSTAFHETMAKHDPKTIGDFVDKLHSIASKAEYMRKEALRWGSFGGTESSRRDSSSYRDSRRDTSSHRDRSSRDSSRDRGSRGGRYDTHRDKRPRRAESQHQLAREEAGRETTEHISAISNRGPSAYGPTCAGCGKKGHDFRSCPFIKENHPDVNRDANVAFRDSAIGTRWRLVTGRHQLTTAFDSRSYKKQDPANQAESNRTGRGQSPSPRRSTTMLSPLTNTRHSPVERTRGDSNRDRSRSRSRSESHEQERERARKRR